MENTIEKLNNYTTRPHTLEEVFIFKITLCDNEIDRQNEAFSDDALEKLSVLFLGKTGIFDHNTRDSKQTARIFDTEVITDPEKVSKSGKPYKYLSANAYMVRTESNIDLIKEIEGGIRKEVSVSCNSETKQCSVCGCNRIKKSCSHVPGVEYNGKICYHILENPSDAYEWSFVAVPAQVNAGVTKKYGSVEITEKVPEDYEHMQKTLSMIIEDLKKDIIKMAAVQKNENFSKLIDAAIDKLDIDELLEIKENIKKSIVKASRLQLD
ncbi:MAG: hypothetical protein LBL93_01090 [Ruminococcus sp.]|jgi:hypothetical protein|nr:hypothetical protein [Ruminococcus sp.]